MFLYIELGRMYKKIGPMIKIYIQISENSFQIVEKLFRAIKGQKFPLRRLATIIKLHLKQKCIQYFLSIFFYTFVWDQKKYTGSNAPASPSKIEPKFAARTKQTFSGSTIWSTTGLLKLRTPPTLRTNSKHSENFCKS